jgi:hypothetical protein
MRWSDPRWSHLTDYERLALVFEVATIYFARTTGVSRAVLDAQGPPYLVGGLDADPVTIAWRDGSRLRVPADALAAGVALRLAQDARRHDRLN